LPQPDPRPTQRVGSQAGIAEDDYGFDRGEKTQVVETKEGIDIAAASGPKDIADAGVT
jgi:hypothetical protein